ncbi:hypothetical protein [Bacillus dakarensis]|uniref:hypothetical protein n=1 Tax=Robertmurraya dakarensis TaxID=1926278 RepID=UPI000980A523|nr:hypothetical protein [Bacillus dakarensis]
MGFSWKVSAKYLTYAVGFIILLIFSGEIYSYFQGIQQDTYKLVPWSIYATLTYIPIGIYLGLPKLLKEKKKAGKWKINFQKLLFIGLPILYFVFYWYFPFSYPIPEFLVHTNIIFRHGGTIIVGYILIDSFIKE